MLLEAGGGDAGVLNPDGRPLFIVDANECRIEWQSTFGCAGGISKFPMSGCGGSGPLSKASAGSRGESFSAAINIFVDVQVGDWGMISEDRYCRSDSTVQDVS